LGYFEDAHTNCSQLAKSSEVFEDKSRDGIAGNEVVDAVARYPATQADASHADTGML